MGVRERIDEQILERAPWLGRDGAAVGLTRRALHRTLSYHRTVALAQEMEDWSGHALMSRMGRRIF